LSEAQMHLWRQRVCLMSETQGSQTRGPHVTRDGIFCAPRWFWEFSKYQHFSYLVDPPVFESARLASDQVP